MKEIKLKDLKKDRLYFASYLRQIHFVGSAGEIYLFIPESDGKGDGLFFLIRTFAGGEVYVGTNISHDEFVFRGNIQRMHMYITEANFPKELNQLILDDFSIRNKISEILKKYDNQN